MQGGPHSAQTVSGFRRALTMLGITLGVPRIIKLYFTGDAVDDGQIECTHPVPPVTAYTLGSTVDADPAVAERVCK